MDITLDWLIGFVEGEGSFFLSKKNGRIRPGFCISQQEAWNELTAIQAFLGYGYVYRNSHADMFQVRDLNECIALIDIFDGKLRLEKRRSQFERWKAFCLSSTQRRLWSQEQENKAIEMLKAGSNYGEVAAAVKHPIKGVENRNYTQWRIEPLARGSRTWTVLDEKKAEDMLSAGFSYGEVAESLARSYNSIKWRNIHIWKLPYCYGDAGIPINSKARSTRSFIPRGKNK